MATGDVLVFEEARASMLDSGWAETDDIKVALITDASVNVAQANPLLGTYTTATTTEGPQSIGSIANVVTEAGGVMTFDSTAASVVWAQGGSNSTNCRWAIIYNDTETTTPGADPAIAYVDLGSNRDLQAGSITITWSTSPDAIFTIT